jgi:hypothetical protein
MTIDTGQIEQSLNTINQSVAAARSPEMFAKLANQTIASKTTALGTSVGKALGGVLSLTQEADDGVTDDIVGKVPIGQLTSELEGLTDKLVVPLNSTNQTEMQAITGSAGSASPAILDVVIHAATPDATAVAVSSAVPSATADQILNVVSKIQSPLNISHDFNTTLADALSPITSAITNVSLSVTSALSSITDPLTSALGKIGLGSEITNQLTGEINKFQSSITDQISRSISSAIPSGVLLPNGITELGVFSSLSGITPREVGSSTNGTSTPSFQAVHTQEELEYDLRTATREITELVVHWTQTSYDQYITPSQLSSITGSIPYHYYINRDGSISRGISLNNVGGALANNHEKYSIQIAFIGGLSTTQTSANNQTTSSNSLTPQQMTSFTTFVQKAYLAWPGLQVVGHNDIDRSARDPGFDVRGLIKKLFGKENVFTDPFSQGPFSRVELVNMKVVQ